MFLEILLGSAVVGAASAGQQVIRDRRRRLAQREASRLWFDTIVASQDIQAQATATRRAMLDEVRRHGVVSQMRGGS